jgi:hypothetical protein
MIIMSKSSFSVLYKFQQQRIWQIKTSAKYNTGKGSSTAGALSQFPIL